MLHFDRKASLQSMLSKGTNVVGLDRTGHMSFLTGQDRTPKFAGQVLPDRTKSGLTFLNILLHKNKRKNYEKKNLKKNFEKKKNLKFFFEKCAVVGARAGTKSGVRVRAPHTIKMCAMCVRVRPKNRAH